ncbi:MAG TPA: hypothetical protein VN213_05025 [Solirubrobacteraceae bacterium]|nr:hypothetical protein [Solirubrobacteraceae bacterium]
MTDEIVEINKDTDVSLLTTIGVNAEAKASKVPMVARVDRREDREPALL